MSNTHLWTFWTQYLMQESTSYSMQLLTLFHDFSLGIIMMILSFVTGIALSMVSNNFLSDVSVSGSVEVIWTVLPVVVLLFLAIPSLNILYYMDENDPYLTIKITGNQWFWSYEYMDLDIEYDSYMGEMNWDPCVGVGTHRLLEVDHRVIVPVNKDIRGLITAADVLHSWAVPSVGVKADAVPGRLNQVFFSMVRTAVVYGQCSEICGANHSFMPICIESLTSNSFLEWCSWSTDMSLVV